MGLWAKYVATYTYLYIERLYTYVGGWLDSPRDRERGTEKEVSPGYEPPGYIYIHMYMHIYIYRKRKYRERSRTTLFIHIAQIYICIYIYIIALIKINMQMYVLCHI